MCPAKIVNRADVTRAVRARWRCATCVRAADSDWSASSFVTVGLNERLPRNRFTVPPSFAAFHEVGLIRKLKPYFSKTDFAVCVRKNNKYCIASDLAFSVNATG
jgi:hypothetical protein